MSHDELLVQAAECLQNIIEIGKRDMSNPKYDGYFEEAREVLQKLNAEKQTIDGSDLVECDRFWEVMNEPGTQNGIYAVGVDPCKNDLAPSNLSTWVKDGENGWKLAGTRDTEFTMQPLVVDGHDLAGKVVAVLNQPEMMSAPEDCINHTNEPVPGVYQYGLTTWGGFYQPEYRHYFVSGDFFFNTKLERDAYIEVVLEAARRLGKIAAFDTFEGCNVQKTVLNRLSEWEGERVHTHRSMFYRQSLGSCLYHLAHKWYPGFNDYPFGEDFDYEKNKITIIDEWIEGSFSTNELPDYEVCPMD
jgi:hypothetical protein